MLTWQRHPAGTQSIGESKVGSMAILVICYPKGAYGSDGESKVTGAGKIGVLSFGIHQWLLIFTNGDFQNKVAFSPLIQPHFETSKLIMVLGKTSLTVSFPESITFDTLQRFISVVYFDYGLHPCRIFHASS